MSKLDKKLDYSNFSDVELTALKAISINNSNNDGVEPLFPELSQVFNALITQVEDAPAEMAQSVWRLAEELNVIARYLLSGSPTLPEGDPETIAQMFSNDEMIKHLLTTGIINYLVINFNALQSTAFEHSLKSVGVMGGGGNVLQ